jgi:hypothetical protein
MKKLLILILLLPQLAMATMFTGRVDFSVTNANTTYQKIQFNGNPTIHQIISVTAANNAAAEVWVDCAGTSSLAPAANDASALDLAASGSPGSAWALDDAGLGNACYVKTQTGSLVLGILTVTVTGR